VSLARFLNRLRSHSRHSASQSRINSPAVWLHRALRLTFLGLSPASRSPSSTACAPASVRRLWLRCSSFNSGLCRSRPPSENAPRSPAGMETHIRDERGGGGGGRRTQAGPLQSVSVGKSSAERTDHVEVEEEGAEEDEVGRVAGLEPHEPVGQRLHARVAQAVLLQAQEHLPTDRPAGTVRA
jgi:hypothetical protein